MKSTSFFAIVSFCAPLLGAGLLHCGGSDAELVFLDDAAVGSSSLVDAAGGHVPEGGSDARPVDATTDHGGTASDGSTGEASTRAEAGTGGPDAAACVSGTPCSLGACATGAVVCDAAGQSSCMQIAESPDGTACGTGSVCSNGTCSPCAQGTSCAAPGSCQQATISCATGVAVCTTGQNVPDGTACGTNLYCNGGMCAPCTNGAACVPTASPCDVGTVSCTTGTAVCVDKGTSAADGTSCGTNQVCSGGSCTACTSGATCTPSGEPCKTGTTSCTTGTPVCKRTQNVADGTSCGMNEVCSGGQCTPCASGTSCTPTGNACEIGVTSCTTGSQVCMATGRLNDGASCGMNQVCHAGQCNPCAEGASCYPDGDPCRVGTTSCTTGVSECTDVTTSPDGAACEDGSCSNGMCMPCVPGAACASGDPCKTGVTACTDGGQSECVVSPVPDGTSCSMGDICCGGTCVDATSDDAACGATCIACDQGTSCVASICTPTP